MARNKERLIGHGRLRRQRRIPVMSRPEVDLRRRGFSVAYWNETGIEKERCVWSLVEFFKPRKYPVVTDDGWQPWDLRILAGTPPPDIPVATAEKTRIFLNMGLAKKLGIRLPMELIENAHLIGGD